MLTKVSIHRYEFETQRCQYESALKRVCTRLSNTKSQKDAAALANKKGGKKSKSAKNIAAAKIKALNRKIKDHQSEIESVCTTFNYIYAAKLTVADTKNSCRVRGS